MAEPRTACRALVYDEAELLTLAAALGVALPGFSRKAAPDLFQGWADRIVLAAVERDRGRLVPAAFDALLDACDRQLGLPGTRVPLPVFAGLRPFDRHGADAGTLVDLREVFARERDGAAS